MTWRTSAQFCLLVAIWLASYKSAAIFGFFKSYSSLWFLPAGATLAIVMVAPGWLKSAPLAANLLLAIPAVCWALGVEHTNYRDPILHAFRLYAVYGGAALLLVHAAGIRAPTASLRDTLWIIGASLAAAGIAAASGVSLHVAVGNMDWNVARAIMVPWSIGDAIGAIIVPPLLVPLLWLIFQPVPTQWRLPTLLSLACQLAAICVALAVGFAIPPFNADLGSLWYVIIIPPIVFALRGGLPAAATSVFLTSMLTPPAAYFLNYQGQRLELQLLLLITSIAGLVIGAAISDRRRAFDDLSAHRAQLEILVQQRTGELESAYDFQRHLVRSIGHDLRQPIQSMIYMLDGLVQGATDRQYAEALKRTREIGANASELLSKILNYARSDAGHVLPDSQPFPVQRVFTTLEHIYAPIAQAKGVDLIINRCELVFMSDEHLIIEALSNYLDNAIRLSAAGMRVWLVCEQDAEGTWLLIRDEIAQAGQHRQGSAGFGQEIVIRIAELLDLRLRQGPNTYGVALEAASLPSAV